MSLLVSELAVALSEGYSQTSSPVIESLQMLMLRWPEELFLVQIMTHTAFQAM
jgi:hypothetical protein